MKHSNQDGTSKNQGVASDQNKKANKSHQGTPKDAMESKETKQNRERHSGQGGNGSNWQKEKQGNKK